MRLGISTCLLGERVRYDGNHKHDRFLTGTLGTYVEYVPVCPEHECGFGVPREAFRLEGDPERPRLMTVNTRQDCTDRMESWAKARVQELERENLCGFIFKSKSPSSGMERVKVYNDKGMPEKTGVGIFARIFMEHFPLLPVEDEGRLHDPVLRENFIERIFALNRWNNMVSSSPSPAGVIDFHTRHKLLLLAHSPAHYRAMGRMVAKVNEWDTEDFLQSYQEALLNALKVHATRKKHTNVLQHAMGYFKDELSADEKQEMLAVIDQYHSGITPLLVPLVLLQHYVRKYDQAYLKQQFYLNPHPQELQLRNHA
ncbi:MAG: DUF523 and DUF1722 domain-containing protein [Candidatus Pacebacteria bacterium]|nr:DUF523 and DUF1722 domain-containing protein [Candidatus Paceibacterota bacterium]